MKAKNSLMAFLCPELTYYILNIRSYLIVPLLITGLFSMARQPSYRLSGTVMSSSGKRPLAGATVKIEGQKNVVYTNDEGKFTITTTAPEGNLLINFIGYKPARVSFNTSDQAPVSVMLYEDENLLQEVQVSTGYQTIPKERATGSFAQADSALLSHRVSTNVLDRLDGLVSGLTVNRNLSSLANNSSLTIRGRSTIFASPEPLIVLDNFPYDGDLNNLNAGDVESITVLKDAAAASIWGVRAGNGVIVITTRKGRQGRRPQVSLTANTTIGQKPDLYASPWIAAPGYIRLEEYLFGKGYYNTAIADGYSPLSPAVEVFLRRRNGQITAADSAALISELAQYDIRQEWGKYFYRTPVNQQYQLSISGGSPGHTYYLSGSYDQNSSAAVTGSYRRLTLNAATTTELVKDRLELYTGVLFAGSTTQEQLDAYTPFTPYDRLEDDAGNALEAGAYLRPSYTDTAGNGGLLSWKYRPLEELSPDHTTDLTDYRMNARLSYRLLKGLQASLYYQYQKGISSSAIVHGADSWYTRNLTNTYSWRDGPAGQFVSAIAPGEVRSNTEQGYRTHNGRAQLEYARSFKSSSVNAVAGMELKDYSDSFSSQVLYGYDPANATNANALIDATRYYTNYYSGSGDLINTSPWSSLNDDRYVSYYFLGSFTSRDRYTLTLSARKDRSNIFGVSSNQKGVPLWSAGAAWEVSRENFYNLSALPYLRLRATYGYNGNTDKSTSAYLTARTALRNQWGNIGSEVLNPPNPSLQWEKVQNINIGADFATRGRALSGSAEFYLKKGTDLIGNSPIMPQTGVTTFRGNSADTRTRGMDLTLSARLQGGLLKWNPGLLLSLVSDKITRYRQAPGTNADIVSRNYQNPLEGYPYYSVFSYRWAGLDAQGNPQGYLNGEPTTAYASVSGLYDPSQLVYHGPATPTLFGSVHSDLAWKYLSLWLNVTYKAGYYFRRTSVFAGSPYSFRQADYDQRWQQPGDEQNTTVPSLVYPANASRAAFYSNSEVLVEKGDHVRLQDVRLACSLAALKKRKDSESRTSGQVYLYMSNIGILWKANKRNPDPDYGYSRPPLMTSLGINLNFR